MIRSLAFLFVFVAMTACASVVAQSPAQRVFAAQSDYNGILSIAVAYETQPRCTPTPVKVPACSSPTVVAEIRRADIAAYAAIQAAQNTVRTPNVSNTTVELAITGALNAINAFRTIAMTYKVGG